MVASFCWRKSLNAIKKSIIIVGMNKKKQQIKKLIVSDINIVRLGKKATSGPSLYNMLKKKSLLNIWPSPRSVC